jgi:hypothetical protein
MGLRTGQSFGEQRRTSAYGQFHAGGLLTHSVVLGRFMFSFKLARCCVVKLRHLKSFEQTHSISSQPQCWFARFHKHYPSREKCCVEIGRLTK